jgi:hypothetical protein
MPPKQFDDQVKLGVGTAEQLRVPSEGLGVLSLSDRERLDQVVGSSLPLRQGGDVAIDCSTQVRLSADA